MKEVPIERHVGERWQTGIRLGSREEYKGQRLRATSHCNVTILSHTPLLSHSIVCCHQSHQIHLLQACQKKRADRSRQSMSMHPMMQLSGKVTSYHALHRRCRLKEATQKPAEECGEKKCQWRQALEQRRACVWRAAMHSSCVLLSTLLTSAVPSLASIHVQRLISSFF